MTAIFKIFLILHIVSGAISLLVAPVAMIVEKGGEAHRKWGRTFFWAMTIVFVTAVVLSIVSWNPFLLMIGVFSYYSIVSGYRWLYLKKRHLGQQPKTIDWVALVITTLFNICFVIWGIYMAVNNNYSIFAYLAIGFGLGGLMVAKGNLVKFLKHPPKNAWIYEHIGGMIGGYIATVTAFSSQMMNFLPGWMQWIWPTLIGIPLMAYWIRKYKNKFERSNDVH